MVGRFLILVSLLVTVVLKAQLSNSFYVNFETNGYELTQSHFASIDSVIAGLPNIPEGYNVEIKGHTDSKGSLELNTELSKKRATSVSNYLKSKHFKITDTSIKFYAYKEP